MAKSNVNRDESKSNTQKIARIAAIVVVVAFLGALLVNSNFVRRRATAVVVGDVKFSAAEASYFYREAISEYTNMAYSYLGESASAILPEQGKSLSNQTHPSTGTTWEYFFSDNAYNSMLEVGALYSEAMASGFTIDAAKQAEFDGEIEMMNSQVVLYGYKSLDDYIKQMYNNTINEADFIRLANMRFVVGEYTQYINDSFDYSAAELDEFYKANSAGFDVYTYRYFIVKAAPSGDGEVLTAEDVTAAEKQANGYITAIGNEVAFIEAAREYDETMYAADDATLRNYSGDNLAERYGEWVREPQRKPGDITSMPVMDDDLNDSFYVLYYVGRSDNDYATRSYREMVFSAEPISATAYTDAETGEFDADAYDAALAEAEATYDRTAQKHVDDVKAAGGAELAELKLIELTENEFNLATGSLYENVDRNSAVIAAEIRAWLYEPSRRAGDVTAIKDADDSYHIVLYKGEGDNYRDVLADTRLRSADFAAWQDSYRDVTGKITFLYRLRLTA